MTSPFLLFDAGVILLRLFTLIVQQHVLPRAEPELEDVLLEHLDVLPRFDLLVVDERSIRRAQVDHVGRHPAATCSIGALKNIDSPSKLALTF